MNLIVQIFAAAMMLLIPAAFILALGIRAYIIWKTAKSDAQKETIGNMKIMEAESNELEKVRKQ